MELILEGFVDLFWHDLPPDTAGGAGGVAGAVLVPMSVPPGLPGGEGAQPCWGQLRMSAGSCWSSLVTDVFCLLEAQVPAFRSLKANIWLTETSVCRESFCQYYFSHSFTM